MTARFLTLTACLFAGTILAQPPAAPKQTPAPKPAAPAAAPAKPATPPRPPGLYATLSLVQGTVPLGNITFVLYDKESPVTVKNFVDLAQGRKAWLNPKTNTRVTAPLYNGLTFHRVIPDFMIQGGDPLGNGMGGTDAIIDEFHPSLKFDQVGRVAMANAGPGTGSSQFFITDGLTPHLNGKHTIFGQVIEGQELVAKVARVPTGPGNKPNVPVRMSRVLITRVADPNAPKPPAPAPVKKAIPAAKPVVPAAKPAVPAAKPAAAAPTKKG